MVPPPDKLYGNTIVPGFLAWVGGTMALLWQLSTWAGIAFLATVCILVPALSKAIRRSTNAQKGT